MRTVYHLKQHIIEAFKSKYPDLVDDKGYVKQLEHNLLDGINLDGFVHDLERGSGKELEGKFYAIHSSSVLVVNHFAPFKNQIDRLKLFGLENFTLLQFEKKLPTGLGGTPPNLDLYLENEHIVVGVESKYLEVIDLKVPKFSDSYNREKLPYLKDHWFKLINKYRNKEKMYLDVAQLIKHSIGALNNNNNKDIYLVYLYWEPLNINENKEYQIHKEEINELFEDFKQTEINFISRSYKDLWNEWDRHPEIMKHCEKLEDRYMI